jgi:hypothetical protein
MTEPEIPFMHFSFRATDPDHPSHTELDDHKNMTLGVKRMTIPLLHPTTAVEGLCLRFSDLKQTPGGKTQGEIFFLSHKRALDHLITQLLELRNQMYGPFQLNNQN